MKFFAPLALAGAAAAAPLAARAINDVDILQFALVLEHLENRFYAGALQKFSQADFAKAGFDDYYYRNLKFIAKDEASHVAFLEAGLSKAGSTPSKECQYTFPYNSVKSFIGLSSVLEHVGTSAYLGAAPAISDKGYLTAAGSILATEAKHTSLQRYVIGKIAPDNAYQPPISPNAAYTLAAAFIVSCPSDNYKLPLTGYPTLTAQIGNLPQVGQTHITDFSVDPKKVPSGNYYLTFVSGLDIVSVKATKGKSAGYYSAPVPQVAEGQTYVLLTKAPVNGTIEESNVVAGPAILEVCSNL